MPVPMWAPAAARAGSRAADAAAAHDDDRVGRRRRDSRQVPRWPPAPHAVSPELKWSQVPTGHAELRAADARSRAGAQQGLEDGHHALVDLEHPGHIDRSARRRRRGRAAGRQPAGQPARERLHGSRRAAGSVPSLHVRAVRARHQARVPQGTPQEAAATRTAVINAMDGHVLGKAGSSPASIGHSSFPVEMTAQQSKFCPCDGRPAARSFQSARARSFVGEEDDCLQRSRRMDNK